MQAQELFPQVQKLPLSEQMALLSHLVQLIQREVVNTEPQQTVLERMGGMPQHLLSVGGYPTEILVGGLLMNRSALGIDPNHIAVHLDDHKDLIFEAHSGF